MPLRTIHRLYEFPPEERSVLTFSDPTKITIASRSGGVALRKDSAGDYPVEAGITVATEAFNPQALRQWTGVMPIVTHVSVDNVQVTTAQYKANDGTDDYYWDGGAWAVAGAGDWNTLDELEANFPTFPVASKTLVLIVNLATSDKRYTPTLHTITVGFTANVTSFVEEYVYDALVAALKANIRPAADWSVLWATTGTDYDFSAYEFDNGMAIDEIIEAYDADGDPTYTTDLFSAYDTGTKVLTLSGSVSAGTRVMFRFIPTIIVAASTHQDFDELAHLPALVLRSYTETFEGGSPAREKLISHATGIGKSTRSPRRVRYEVPVDIYVDRAVPIARIAEALEEFAVTSPILTTPGIGAKVRIDMLEGASLYARPDEDGVLRGVTRFAVCSCQKWFFATTDERGISLVVVNPAPA